MARRDVKDLEASIRARLLKIAKETGENYNAVLLRFFQERFLARLAESRYQKHFVLKGGLLLLVHHGSAFRPTVDIDMLGIDISNEPEVLVDIIRQIAELELKDGVRFRTSPIDYKMIREDAEYQGWCFSFGVSLGKIKTRMQVDIGFGDAVAGDFLQGKLPSLLPDISVAELLLYPLETVIAEKFQAMVYLGMANSRMKDVYDILFLAKNTSFLLENLREAIDLTFIRRKTDVNRRFFLYQSEFIQKKEKMWRAFLKKIGSSESLQFSSVIEQIKKFLEPVLRAKKDEFDLVWEPKIWAWKESERKLINH